MFHPRLVDNLLDGSTRVFALLDSSAYIRPLLHLRVVPDCVVARNYLENNASIASCFLYTHVVAGVRPVQIFPHDLHLQFYSLFGFRNNTSSALSSNTNVWSSVGLASSHRPR